MPPSSTQNLKASSIEPLAGIAVSLLALCLSPAALAAKASARVPRVGFFSVHPLVGSSGRPWRNSATSKANIVYEVRHSGGDPVACLSLRRA
jgi:hypothetical protein